jgi:hypothetical protein
LVESHGDDHRGVAEREEIPGAGYTEGTMRRIHEELTLTLD